MSLAAYKEPLLFLAAAGVVAPLFRRLKLSPVIGFLAVGALLGPHGLGRLASAYPLASAFSFSDTERMQHFAELGVVFLLFTIGLELSFDRLKRMRRLVFGLGALQVFISALALGSVALMLGINATTAAVVGCALALSSTAIVMPVMSERKRLHSSAGRAVFAILLFQDLMVAPLLFMVSMLGGDRSGADAGLVAGVVSGLLTILPALGMLALLIGLGRTVFRPLFQQVAMARSTEFFMAACLLVAVGSAIAAASAGLSMALGAFVAGLLLSETEYRREVEVTIEPFKGLLLGVFFVSVGANLDMKLVVEQPWQTVGVAAVFVAIKIVALLAIARSLRFPWQTAQEIALPLGPGGEFAFVMIGAAITAGIVDPALGNHIFIATTLSMLLIPVFGWVSGLWLRMRPEAQPDLSHLMPDIDDSGHVIVIGYGRVGALVSDMLHRHEIAHIATDSDPKVVLGQRDSGRRIYYGDATRADFLRKCGLAGARAVVLTMNSPRAVEMIVPLVRAERPDITIVARARDASHATVLYGLGATDAVPETIEASLQLSEAVLVDIGIPMGYVIASIHEKRDEYRKLLQPAAGVAREQRGIRMSTRIKNMKRPARSGGAAGGE